MTLSDKLGHSILWAAEDTITLNFEELLITLRDFTGFLGNLQSESTFTLIDRAFAVLTRQKSGKYIEQLVPACFLPDILCRMLHLPVYGYTKDTRNYCQILSSVRRPPPPNVHVGPTSVVPL